MNSNVTNDVKPNRPTPSKGNLFLRLFLLPALFGALVATAVLYVPLAGWNSNDVTTGKHPGYPDLQPRTYDSSPTNTLRFAAAAASTIRNWKVVHRDESNGTLSVEIKTVIPVFTDDLTVIVTPTGPRDDSSRVTIRSHSRVGRSDLGENARHIRALQAAMDDKLPRME